MKKQETKSALRFAFHQFTQVSLKTITKRQQIQRVKQQKSKYFSRNGISSQENSILFFLPDLEIWHVRFLLNGPDFRDPLEIAKVLTPFIQAGAVSPNDLRDLAGRILGKTLEEWPEELYHRPLESRMKSAEEKPQPEPDQLTK